MKLKTRNHLIGMAFAFAIAWLIWFFFGGQYLGYFLKDVFWYWIIIACANALVGIIVIPIASTEDKKEKGE